MDAFKHFAYEVPIISFFSFFMAVLLNQDFKGRTVMRAIFFLPIIITSGVISIVIAQGMSAVEMGTTSGNSLFDASLLAEFLVNYGITQIIVNGLTMIVSNIAVLVWESGIQILIFLIKLLLIPLSYYFDVISWFTSSNIVSVRGTGSFLDGDCKNLNYGMIITETQNGCTGIYEAGWSKQLPAQSEKLFVGEKGYIKLELANDRIENREEGDLITVYLSETGEYKVINSEEKYKDMYAQLSSLIYSIENDTDTIPSFKEALNATNVTFSAVKAVNEKRNVTLNNIIY